MDELNAEFAESLAKTSRGKSYEMLVAKYRPKMVKGCELQLVGSERNYHDAGYGGMDRRPLDTVIASTDDDSVNRPIK